MDHIVVMRTNSGKVIVVTDDEGDVLVMDRDQAISTADEVPDAFLAQVVELDEL